MDWFIVTGLQVGGDKLATLETRHCNVDFCYPSYADINAGAGVHLAVGGVHQFSDFPVKLKAQYGFTDNILVGDNRSYRVGLERKRMDLAMEYQFHDRLSLAAGHSWYWKMRLDLNDAGGDIIDFADTTGAFFEINFTVERHNGHEWRMSLQKGFAEYQQIASDGVAIANGPVFDAGYTGLIFTLIW